MTAILAPTNPTNATSPKATALTSKQRSTHELLRTNFQYFAATALMIKDKEGNLIPFVFNSAQEYLHKKLEEQRRLTGRVRAIVVKGRQQGCSTYIGGRYYHRACWKKGQSVFILSHQSETTKKLFKIVERYWENTPEPIKPTANVANRRELHFADLGSEYSVGTAGSENVGRGSTIQLFHGSEAAFWERTDEIQTGAMQAVPDSDDSELILESTANGMGNMFYNLTMDAVAELNEYMVVFIPWYWQTEYVRATPHNKVVVLNEEEEEYAALYKLTKEQMYWRRAKIAAFRSAWKFKQEYPAYLQEAFQASGISLIDPEKIIAARKATITDEQAPLVYGVDPGRNRDRTVFVSRRGRQLNPPEVFQFEKEENVQMNIAGMLVQRIQRDKPVKVFIDVGEGRGVIDRLKEMGYGHIVTGVNFGSKPMLEEQYLNKRAEMWCMLRDWLHGEDGPVSIPDDDNLQRDLTLVPEAKTGSSGKTQLVPKAEIRKNTGYSPDIGDACALTFAYPVSPLADSAIHIKRTMRVAPKKHTLKALQRLTQRDNGPQDMKNHYWGKTR